MRGEGDPELAERGTNQALDGVLKTKRIVFANEIDPLSALQSAKDEVFAFLRQRLALASTKFYIVMSVVFEKDMPNGDLNLIDVVLPEDDGSSLHTLLHDDQLDGFYQTSSREIEESIQRWLTRGSGFRLREVTDIFVETSRYKPLRGSSYIPTPEALVKKKGVVNVQNMDAKCFEYAILAALHYHELPRNSTSNCAAHPERPSSYAEWIGKELNMTGMSEPALISEIDAFERNNRLSINVWITPEKGGSVDPLRISRVEDDDWFKVDLLLIEGQEFSHYCWIRNLDRLLHNDSMSKHHYIICRNCGKGFNKSLYNKERMEFHRRTCNSQDAQRLTIPENRIIKFTNWAYTLKAPVIIYADFECLNTKISSCEPPPTKKKGRRGGKTDAENSYTEKKTIHEVCGYSFTVVSPYYPGRTFSYRATEGGVNAAEHFLKAINRESDKIIQWFKRNEREMYPLTEEEEKAHQQASHCHICKGPFAPHIMSSSEEEFLGDPDTRVRDHCHYTGHYRGPAHNHCNLSYRKQRKIPLFIHNLQGYDAALIMQHVQAANSDPRVIARNLESFLAFDIYRVSYRDSFQHLSSSLSTLVGNLKKNVETVRLKDKFPNLWKYFKNKWSHLPIECFQMLTKKLPFPYKYFDSLSRFAEQELPPIEEYYNDLMDEPASDEDYAFAQDLWGKFRLNTLGDLHDLYVEVDTLLLADVFENYREVSLATYGLDPAHFVTAPSLSWNAALLYTGVELEIPPEVEMHQFFDLGLRGGISQVSNCYAQANNAYMGEDYDPEKPDTYLIQFDCNNEYGKAMMGHLPHGNFSWVKEEELCNVGAWEKKISEWADDAPQGCALEVTLDYPPDLFEQHDALPLAPENLTITKEMLTPYQAELAKKFTAKLGGDKLCLSLTKKKNYICHYRNLKYYLSKGMKLEKVHQVLMFDQSDWLRSYVSLNTNMRRTATSEAEKDFAKLMNNSFFGKTAENKKAYKNVRLTTRPAMAEKLSAKPTVKRWKSYNGKLASFLMRTTNVVLDKPRYVGFTILEESKLILDRFHYDFVLPTFGGDKEPRKVKVCHIDTDSFTYKIECNEDLYRVLAERTDIIDFSNYPPHHPCFNKDNYLQPGFWKDEAKSEPIQEFVGLR